MIKQSKKIFLGMVLSRHADENLQLDTHTIFNLQKPFRIDN